MRKDDAACTQAFDRAWHVKLHTRFNALPQTRLRPLASISYPGRCLAAFAAAAAQAAIACGLSSSQKKPPKTTRSQLISPAFLVVLGCLTRITQLDCDVRTLRTSQKQRCDVRRTTREPTRCKFASTAPTCIAHVAPLTQSIPAHMTSSHSEWVGSCGTAQCCS